MKALIPMDEYGLFSDTKDVVRVDSRFIAEAFEKEHKTILRNIDTILNPDSGFTPEFGRHNFVPISYTDSHGRKQRAYQMTRDGFVSLVMGFSGKKAAHFKELYINRFSEMEKQINTLTHVRDEFPRLTEQINFLNPNANRFVYSNECNMLNCIVLGMNAKQFRTMHGIAKGDSIRPYLSVDQLSMLDYLQNLDCGLMLGVHDFQERKRLLRMASINHAGKS